MDRSQSITSMPVGEDASQLKRGLFRRVLDFVFGYDLFISYKWDDGSAYAVNLARTLELDGFDVFLDRDDYASGDDWKQVGTWTLRRTGQLILVGSPLAMRSEAVTREVNIFSKTGRRIIPIDFGGSLEADPGSPVLALLSPYALRIREPPESLALGLPKTRSPRSVGRSRSCDKTRNACA